MKTIKLILNILSVADIAISAVMPFLLGAFLSFFGLFFHWRNPNSQLVFAWISTIALFVVLVFAVIKLVLSIISFHKRERLSTKTYTKFEVIHNIMAFVSYVAMLCIFSVVIFSPSWLDAQADVAKDLGANIDLYIYLILPAVGLFFEVISFILTIVDAVNNRKKKIEGVKLNAIS